jgi:hypothetical protein
MVMLMLQGVDLLLQVMDPGLEDVPDMLDVLVLHFLQVGHLPLIEPDVVGQVPAHLIELGPDSLALLLRRGLGEKLFLFDPQGAAVALEPILGPVLAAKDAVVMGCDPLDGFSFLVPQGLDFVPQLADPRIASASRTSTQDGQGQAGAHKYRRNMLQR